MENPPPKAAQQKEILKATSKENTRPSDIQLHTQQRAAKRAIFNHYVESKLLLIELEKNQLQKLQKMIEEEEIRKMRKYMVPKAQLMPYFDRPFNPQRSSRPLTIPKEPRVHMLSDRCWRCNSCNEMYNFQYCQPMKSIK
ncbi:hypothetical protein Dimus_033278 [Dionaea muscipula]